LLSLHGSAPEADYEGWLTELVDAGDGVVVLLRSRMRGRSSGIEVPFGESAFVTTFRDGLMLHNTWYASESEALEAVGMRERDARVEPC